MSLRDRVITIIDKHFDQSLDPDQRRDLERGIYNASIQDANRKGVRKHWENPDFTEIYKMISRRTVANLDPTVYVGNARLLQRLQDGEFEPRAVPFMSSRELYPEHWQALADENMKRENTMLEGDKAGGSDMFKCKKCKKSRVKYWEMQTRSADEPMSIFVRCLNCGHNWREQ
jgi:DNA-directed RNA polymerase subunit M/transcription elongation factor TFIIS